MVEAAVTDVVGPAVAAEDPDGLLVQVLFVLQDLGRLRATVLGSSLERGNERLDGLGVRLAIGHGVEVRRDKILGLSRRLVVSCHGFQLADQAVTHRLVTQQHAQTVLGIVLEQGVRPRRPATLCVHRIRRRSGRTAPDGRATRGVRDVHAIAEQLGDQLGVRRFGAAGAGAGELQQRLLELAALDRGILERRLLGHVVNAVVEHVLLRQLAFRGHHRQRVGGAHVHAHAAAHAVERGHGQRVLQAGSGLAHAGTLTATPRFS